MISSFTGLKINRAKSCFATGKKHDSRDSIIKSITEFNKSDLPLNYLGCPLFWGRNKSIYFLPTILKIQNKLAAWKGKILLLGAKLVLIKHVILSMPLYIIVLINPTSEVFKQINKLVADFFGMIGGQK